MRTFSLLKGLPVFEVKSGLKIGEVYDLNISGEGRVYALMVRNGLLIKKTLMVRLENVFAFGKDGIMVKDAQVFEPLKATPARTFERSLAGKAMFSSDGTELGLLEDVYFLEKLGTIIGYKLTDGFFSDLTEGKQVIQIAAPPAIGEEAIIVDVNPV